MELAKSNYKKLAKYNMKPIKSKNTGPTKQNQIRSKIKLATETKYKYFQTISKEIYEANLETR